tara:strand:+ start:280 stop:891 length:612 start_codon:yes stop_codon:yes gene_type:complete
MNEIINKNISGLEEKRIILKNIILMIYNRGLINKSDIDKLYDDKLKNKEINEIKIKLNNGKELLIKFFINKLSSIKKIDDIENIIKNNKHNIFIIKNIQNKIWNRLIEYNIEIFYDFEFMLNLIDHDLQPKFKKLSNDEKKEFFNIYNIQLKKLPKMLLYDPIARYYKYEIDDIIQITRPSITSGYSITYRAVVNSPVPDIEP